MPLYEYECDANGHRFEVIQKFSDPPLEVCPQCGSTVHKLIAAPAFHLKGSGWYLTDYAKKDSGAGKADAAAKGEKTDKAEKSDKGDKAEKTSTPAESTTSATPPAPSKSET